jgi:2-aminoethylphosphonate dioxygenase
MRAAGTSLTDDDVRAFARDGYVVLRGLLDAATMRDLMRWTDGLQAEPEVPGRHMVYGETNLLDGRTRIVQRIENFCPFHAGFDQVLRRGALTEAVSRLLGEPAVMFKEKINLKLPGGDGFKPHQDQQAGWSRYASLFVTALVALDDATLENGCLEIVAGQHRRGLIGPEWRPLSAEEMAGFTLEPVPTRSGDVILFDSYVPHGSGPNLTSRPRRVLYVTYNRHREGDHRTRYFAEKRAAFPPDVEREPGKTYIFKV